MRNMKMTTNFLSLAGVVSLGFMALSCTGKYLEINTNPYEVNREQTLTDGYATAAAIAAMGGAVVSTDVNTAQFTDCLLGGPMGGYYSTTGAFEKTIDNYNATDDWTRVLLASDRIIPTLYSNLSELKSITDDPVTLSIANIIKVTAMLRVTDTYGPIPYSQIGQGGKITVAYDSQEKVYDTMFGELDACIKTLTDNRLSAIPSTADPVYDGTAVKWCKFANSLKLRMAMRVSYVAPELAREKASEAAASGELIITNADNAYIHPVENKLALIYNDWNDHRAAADIISYMNGYKDPRREKMFIKNHPSANEESERKYAGLRIGSTVSKKSAFVDGYSNMAVSSGDPLLWMNAAETNFLLSEYELRFTKDNAKAKEYYEQGVILSFEERGATGAEDYLSNTIDTPELYIDPLGNYSAERKMSECKTAWETASDEEGHLEQIITQKWIAIFPLGNEAWAEYRRTGYPKLLPAVQNLGPDKLDLDHHARRLVYPVEEYTSNGVNLSEAISILESESSSGGGDAMSTRLWWDVKPY